MSEILTPINQNLQLIQNSRGLTFGSDSYLLSAYVSGSTRARMADLGSGTGIISLLCASVNKFSTAYAIEIQESFADMIARNVTLNSFEGKIIPICKDIREVSAKDTDGELDIAISNPPYMKADSGKRNQADEKFIARHEVCGDIGDFCACAARLLKHGGKFYTVWRPDRLCDLFVSLRENKLEPKRITFVCATPQSQPSMVLVQSTKGAASGSVVTKSLLLHENIESAKKNVLSAEAKEIYDTCSFEQFFKNA